MEMKEALQWLRDEIARMQRELATGTCRSVAFAHKEIKLQQQRLEFIELYG